MDPGHVFLEVGPLGESSWTALTLVGTLTFGNMFRIDMVCQLYLGASGAVGAVRALVNHTLCALIISVVLCACAGHV